MSIRVNRRRFLQVGAAGTLGYFYTGSAMSVVRAQGSNERLKVAGIGVGGKGSSDIDQAGALMEVVALCDIDAKRLGDKTKKWPAAKGFSDFRKIAIWWRVFGRRVCSSHTKSAGGAARSKGKPSF